MLSRRVFGLEGIMPDRNTVSRPWPTLADVARQNHAVLAACGGLQLLQDDEALAILEPLRTELTKLSLMIEMVAMRAAPEATPCDA
jgi:hypothetical protein